MSLIAAARLRIRSIRFLPSFFVQAFLSQRQARRAAGNLSMDILNDANWTFWTCTAWTDEAAMHAYSLAVPHRHAMMKLAHWCSEAAMAHWQQDSPALAGWHEAHRRMVAE